MAVCRSGFYAWQKRPTSPRALENENLTQQIRVLYQESDQNYGSPRVHKDLKALGLACSEKRVARLMRLADLKAVLPRRFVVTTDSDHALPIAANLLDRQFGSETPDQRWTADITYVWTSEGWLYLWTSEGWLYLAVVLDLFSRRIVGWAMQPNMERSLVLSGLSMALASRQPNTGLLCHSDRGSQLDRSLVQPEAASLLAGLSQSRGIRAAISTKATEPEVNGCLTDCP